MDDEYTNSIGVQAILDEIVKWSSSSRYPTWDTTLINLKTLIRNNTDKDKSDKNIIEDTNKDVVALCSNLQMYFNNIRTKSNSPYVILYIPRYDAIPDICARPLTNTIIRINKLSNIFEKQIEDKINGDLQYIGNIPCYSIIVGDNYNLPYKKLNSIVSKINTSTKNIDKILSRRYMLISSYPLDFHMAASYEYFSLLECYTGKIRSRDTFGEKIFKVPFVPFNKYTHLLFGDKVQIRPITKREHKKKYVELANTNKWKFKTPEEIRYDIANADTAVGIAIKNIKF